VARVLRGGGRFVSISFGQPHFRRRLLLRLAYGWNLTWTPVGDSFHYYVYCMEKGAPDRPRTEADVAAATRPPSSVAVVAAAPPTDADSSDDDDADTFFGKLAQYEDDEKGSGLS
jgi:hypothetical protein